MVVYCITSRWLCKRMFYGIEGKKEEKRKKNNYFLFLVTLEKKQKFFLAKS